MVIDETVEGGIDTDGPRHAATVRSGGPIDFINVIRGHIENESALTEVIPIHGMRRRRSPSSPAWCANTGLAVLHAAKVDEVASARHVIREGKLDLVGMTRAHLADPHIVRKIIEGRESEIRPWGRRHVLPRPDLCGGRGVCLHNAATELVSRRCRT